MTQGTTGELNKSVLATAIKFEEDGRKLFLDCMNKTEHPWGKSLFKSLADDELKHITRLKETFEKLSISDQYTKGPEPLASEKEWKNIFEEARGSVAKTIKAETGDLEALILGMEFEKKGMNYYKKLSEESPNPLEKKFYDIIAKEEHRHYLILQDAHELLTDPSSWYEKTETIGLDGA